MRRSFLHFGENCSSFVLSRASLHSRGCDLNFVGGAWAFAALRDRGARCVLRPARCVNRPWAEQISRDITCDGCVMAEMAQLRRCDGVMDRIASVFAGGYFGFFFAIEGSPVS
jgi:hypothetical protein